MLTGNSVLQLFSVIALLILNGVAFSTKKLDTGFVDIFHTRTTVCVACSTLWGDIVVLMCALKQY
jgi:hypothetical protein